MAQRTNYPPEESDVAVTFLDGEVKTYRISAGAGITNHLADRAAQTGLLVLLNGQTTHNIPIANIRDYTITTVPKGGPA